LLLVVAVVVISLLEQLKSFAEEVIKDALDAYYA